MKNSYLRNKLKLAILFLAAGTLSVTAQSKKKIPSGFYIAVKKSVYTFKETNTNKILYVKPVPDIGVNLIKEVAVEQDTLNNLPLLKLVFSPAGANKLRDITSIGTGKKMLVIIDNHLVTAPVIIGPITGGSVLITGAGTTENAENLKTLLEKEMKKTQE